MAQVKLFGGLPRLAGGNVHQAAGQTVQAVLAELFARFPALQTAVLDGAAPRPYVRIMVNGHDVELGDGLATAVTGEDTIAIFPPIAGG